MEVTLESHLTVLTLSVTMVGVPGKSKGCSTCRKRKKGVSVKEEIFWGLSTVDSDLELSVTSNVRAAASACGVAIPVVVISAISPLFITQLLSK